MQLEKLQLNILKPDQIFDFACSSSLSCFNSCCADLFLPVTPYDMLRLSLSKRMAPASLLKEYCELNWNQLTGFPEVRLLMSGDLLHSCPFVTAKGCAVYSNRPGACRVYPLGRGARLAHAGKTVCYYKVASETCRGFGCGVEQTPMDWERSQGLAPYNRSNDQLMRLLGMVQASGRPIDDRMREFALMALFDLPKFRSVLSDGLSDRLIMRQDTRASLNLLNLAGWEACLEVAIDWLELMIFGVSPRLGVRH